MSKTHHRSDAEIIANTHNTARFFIENRQIAWVLLVGTVAWGIYGYANMPQRKDPDIPARQAMVITNWPGASAEKVEQLVTRTIEQTVASNSNIARIESISRANVSYVTLTLSDSLKDTGQTLDDIGGRLASINTLPQGAGPVNFQRDFGDTATLLLTVASPKADAREIDLRSHGIRKAILATRPKGAANRVSLIVCLPVNVDKRLMLLTVPRFEEELQKQKMGADTRLLDGPGFVGVDFASEHSDGEILRMLETFHTDNYGETPIHPDAWPPFVVRAPTEIPSKLKQVAGEKYSYRELDDFTDEMSKALLATARTPDGPPLVAKVTRSGILNEKIYLLYSQERLASYGLKPSNLENALGARNITYPGGQLTVGAKSVVLNPSGEFNSTDEIGNVTIGVTPYGAPVYLRNVVDTVRAYDDPPQFLNYYCWRDSNGQWQRTRAISVSVQMGKGEKVGHFEKAVDSTLRTLKGRLPPDLIIARASNQADQVRENIHLFMTSLYEAIVLVVIVSLVGFWEWRSALLMALAIPITLLMTFGMMETVGIDLQQVSIATLIIALGLLVDDPVVAGDAIKRDLAINHPPLIAAWLGPTKLAKAIVYATVTNIVAYVPFMLLSGDTGKFLYSLPIVIACSLIASRIVSMTFIPLLGYYLLRPRTEPAIEERRTRGFGAAYYRAGRLAIEHRWLALLISFVVLAVGFAIGSTLKHQFFPKDLSHLAYINLHLPEDAPFTLTDRTASAVERVAEQVSAEQHRSLESLDTFIGGGAPRFWYSLAPESRHANYAQVVLAFRDEHDTSPFLPPLQTRLSREITGARIDVRQLETGAAVGLPVQIRVSGENIAALRATADRVKNILARIPKATRIRDDWGEDRFALQLKVDPDRANLAGITNLDVAHASAGGMNGDQVSVLREGDKQIPIVARLRPNERAQLADVQSLYVYSSSGTQKVPLGQVSRIDYGLQDEVIRRRNQFRTITVSASPQEGVLASEVMEQARPGLAALAAHLPPGYRLEIGGEQEKQEDGFRQLGIVLLISSAAIFLALAFQFNSAIKPFIVFAAVPYGAVGALTALWIMGAPFGFMAFLGIVSLVGVIVSHIIVLFDFIEEMHAKGEPFEQAVLDAGIMRLRPVLITVGATIIALFPLATHGGPLWEPLCYAQIGGLAAATFITLLLVPVIYSICVLDLKIVEWQPSTEQIPDFSLQATMQDTVPQGSR
ncbi:MAG: efflux RND transporter permease subunit [Acidobacteriaceae bacterium]|nr:efflux RND transporter permease subunit [Acidobacteriaceae bacterium]